jgi:hypothetical protein
VGFPFFSCAQFIHSFSLLLMKYINLGHVAGQFSVCWDDSSVGKRWSHDPGKDMVGISGEYDYFVASHNILLSGACVNCNL